MNERIKELAEQANFQNYALGSNAYIVYEKNLNRFAELVRQDERSACAKVCEHWASYNEPAAEACAEAIRARKP